MTAAPRSFGSRLDDAIAERGRLCVGIDPHASLLAGWGLPDDAAGLREFGLRVVEAAEGRVGVIKPQEAFFERHGSAGLAALEEVLAAARAAGLLVIADVKRGEIGSSMEGYAGAWLTPGSPLEADAVTLSPYLGFGSLAPTIDAAAAAGKGVFVLAATSNPEAFDQQTAVLAHGPDARATVAASIVRRAAERNAAEAGASGAGLGSTGVVIGATVRLLDYGIDPARLAGTPVLGPGFGHQGARFADVRSIFGAAAPNVLMSSSRGLLAAGPDGLAAAIDEQAGETRR